MTRSLTLSVALTALVVGSFGCHGAAPVAQDPHAVDPQSPQEVHSTSGGTIEQASDPHAQSSPQAAPQGTSGTTSAPPSAPVAPTTAATGGFKPGTAPAPSGTGGGPKNEGGAVFGDGNQGNTGAVKGGDAPSSPSK